MGSTLMAANDCCTPCGTNSVIIGTSFGWFTVADIASLRLLDDNSLNQFAVVGQNAEYIWSPNSGAADDGNLVIKPTNSVSNGRWLKVTGI